MSAPRRVNIDVSATTDPQGLIVVDRLRLFGRGSHYYDLQDVLVNGTIERTTDGAGTVVLTVLDDDDLTLLNDPVLKAYGVGPGHKPLFYGNILLNDQRYHLVNVSLPQPRRLVLTFEARKVYDLRKNRTPLSVSRGKSTRAEFIERLCKEAGVPLVTPALHKQEPIEKTTQIGSTTEKDAKRKPGFAAHASVKVKGNDATPMQLKNMSIVLEVCASKKAGPLATLAAMCAATGESSFNVVKNPRSVYAGVFQADPKNIPPGETAKQAAAFLDGGLGFHGDNGSGPADVGAIGTAKAHPDWSPGHIAYVVEGDLSNFGGDTAKAAAFYDIYQVEAKANIALWHGGDPRSLLGDSDVYTVSYQFRRGTRDEPESSWDCMRRLAKEVNWHLWEDAGTVYFMPGSYLRRSRPRMLVKPGAPGIVSVTFDIDTSVKTSDTITVECEALQWQAPVGSIAEVQGYGPLDDRWVVGVVKRSQFTTTRITVTLIRPLTPKAEPAAEVRQRSDQSVADAALDDTSTDTGATRPVSLDGRSEAGDVKPDPGNGSLVSQTTRPDGKRVLPNKWLSEFLAQLAGACGHTIWTNTYSRHPQFSSSNLQSDHWVGNGCDVNVTNHGGNYPNPYGMTIAFHAYRLCGLSIPDATAAAHGGGNYTRHPWTYDGKTYSVQVLWGPNVGHLDHVHIGVRP